ncbi:MAG: fimbrial assembly protein [Okeania sp. SIO2D1]|nr:fimbrial assembly protein [Okeania sp. SIO2D1]
MYSLDINFLRDRQEVPGGPTPSQRPTGSGGLQLPLILGILVGILFPALVGGAWFFLRWQTDKLQTRSAELDKELQEIEERNNKISALQTEINQAEAEATALASVFNLVRPWSAILQDIRDRVPEGVQIFAIQQSDIQPEPQATPAPTEGGAAPKEGADTSLVPKMQLTIGGIARSFNEANDFLLSLQQSNFLNGDKTALQSARLIDYPGTLEIPDQQQQTGINIEVELPKVVSYNIQTELDETSAYELKQELRRKGEVGLVSRFEELERQGVVIEP